MSEEEAPHGSGQLLTLGEKTEILKGWALFLELNCVVFLTHQTAAGALFFGFFFLNHNPKFSLF